VTSRSDTTITTNTNTIAKSYIHPPSASAVTSTSSTFNPTKGFQTKSGLVYFDEKVTDVGKTPLFGQLVSFYYSMYYRPSQDSPLELLDSTAVHPGKLVCAFLVLSIMRMKGKRW
jgi:hypothetical protein